MSGPDVVELGSWITLHGDLDSLWMSTRHPELRLPNHLDLRLGESSSRATDTLTHFAARGW